MTHGDMQHPQLIEEVCDSDGVLRLTLNDPATRNSLFGGDAGRACRHIGGGTRQSRGSGDCSGRQRPGILCRP